MLDFNSLKILKQNVPSTYNTLPNWFQQIIVEDEDGGLSGGLSFTNVLVSFVCKDPG